MRRIQLAGSLVGTEEEYNLRLPRAVDEPHAMLRGQRGASDATPCRRLGLEFYQASVAYSAERGRFKVTIPSIGLRERAGMMMRAQSYQSGSWITKKINSPPRGPVPVAARRSRICLLSIYQEW